MSANETPPPAVSADDWSLLLSKPDSPDYIMSLTLPEFSMFNNSVVGGLGEYGGSVEMNLTINDFKQNTAGPRWVISIKNQNALQAYSVWAAKELVDVVGSSNLASLDSSTTRAMSAISSLSKKIEMARLSPSWPKHVLEGRLTTSGMNPILTTGSQAAALRTSADISAMSGQIVKALGSVRTAGEFHVERVVPVTSNTLQVFTMSYCPFGQQIVPILARYVREQNAGDQPGPEMDVRYIFYRSSDDPSAEFFCLHGDPEMQENLVQMTIRDDHPDQFLDYLLARFTNPDTPWENLAEQVGLTSQTVQAMRHYILQNREELVRREYQYVHDIYQVADKSPTYIWNDRVIASPREAPAFKEFDTAGLPAGSCSQ